MVTVSYTKTPNYVSTRGPVKVKRPNINFGAYKNVTKPAPKPVQTPSSGFAGPGNINMPPKGSPRVKSSFKKGGKVKSTGIYKLHKGERVLNAKQTKKFDQKKFDRTKKKVFGL